MKKCPFCGADIEESARFCLYCMQSLTEKEQVLLHQKKKPQWTMIIAAVVVLSLILAVILSGKPIVPDVHSTENTIQLPATSPSTPPATTLETQPAIPDPTQPFTEPTVPSNTLPVTTPETQPSIEPTVPSSTSPVITPETQPTTSDSTQPTTESHAHSYRVQNIARKYLKEEATCISPAVYYYSCTCGEKGSKTFTHGETGEHIEVTKPGYPATCDTPGLSDCRYCSVCQTTFQPHWETPVLGHTYAVGDSPTPCLVCRKMGAVVVQAPDSQYFQNNIFQINSITYTIKPLREDIWAVSVSINCTNVSSSDAHMSPDASLRFYDANGYWTGYGNGTIYTGWVQPNESDTCVVEFSIPNSTDVFKLAVS